jgi:hypothetical protein
MGALGAPVHACSNYKAKSCCFSSSLSCLFSGFKECTQRARLHQTSVLKAISENDEENCKWVHGMLYTSKLRSRCSLTSSAVVLKNLKCFGPRIKVRQFKRSMLIFLLHFRVFVSIFLQTLLNKITSHDIFIPIFNYPYSMLINDDDTIT